MDIYMGKKIVYNTLILFLFLQFVLLLCIGVFFLKKFTKTNRIQIILFTCILFYGIMIYKNDYVSIFLILFISLMILIIASIHEFFYKNDIFRRPILIKEKSDFMFLPIWWFLFYSASSYSFITFYRLVNLIINI